ncbi:unnamed protein product, partial [Prunus brigantina]
HQKKIQNLLTWCLSSVEGNDEAILYHGVSMVLPITRCSGLVTSSLPVNLLDSKHTNLELIGKWKIWRLCSWAWGILSIVKLVPNIKYLNLKGAKVNRDGPVMLRHECKDLVMLDFRDCSGFDENDDEISKLASHISKFMCERVLNFFMVWTILFFLLMDTHFMCMWRRRGMKCSMIWAMRNEELFDCTKRYIIFFYIYNIEEQLCVLSVEWCGVHLMFLDIVL